MLVLVTYDVSTISKGGSKRLRRVARICQNYGQRVQNSVFECVVDATQYTTLKHELRQVMNESCDSIRFYRLGKNYQTKVVHYGVKDSIDLKGPLLF